MFNCTKDRWWRHCSDEQPFLLLLTCTCICDRPSEYRRAAIFWFKNKMCPFRAKPLNVLSGSPCEHPQHSRRRIRLDSSIITHRPAHNFAATSTDILFLTALKEKKSNFDRTITARTHSQTLLIFWVGLACDKPISLHMVLWYAIVTCMWKVEMCGCGEALLLQFSQFLYYSIFDPVYQIF